MTSLALIHGATGIQYFIRRAPIGNPVSPGLWSECRRLSLEVAELAPALLSGEERPKVVVGPDTPPLFTLGRRVWHPVKGEKQTVFFHKDFDIAPGAEIMEAKVQIGADDAFHLYVNGQDIGHSPNRNVSFEYDVSNILRPGRNVIAVKAEDYGGEYGLIVGMRIRYKDGRVMELGSSEQWLTTSQPVGDWTTLAYDATTWERARVLARDGDGVRLQATWPVHAAAWKDRGVVTVLAANTMNQPENLRIRLDGISYSGNAAVLFENRSLAVKNGVIEEMIDAFGTRVYQIPVGLLPAEDLQISPENLSVNASYEEMGNVGTPDGCYVGVGADRGATLFIDSRIARHGRHSLRVTTPTQGQGVGISPFPVDLQKGKAYRVTIWGKARTPGLVFELSLGGLDVGAEQSPLTTEWKEYELIGVAKENHRCGVGLRLISAGTAWFDLLQVVPAEKR